MAGNDDVVESAIETFGGVSEAKVATQVDAFLVARDNYLQVEGQYKRAFIESEFLLKVDPDAISDLDARKKLMTIHALYRGDGGA